MTTAATFPLSRHLYRLSLSIAVTAAAAIGILITIGWAVLSGTLYLPVRTFLSLAAVVILTSGLMYVLFRIALSYHSLVSYMRNLQKIQEHESMIIPVSAPDSPPCSREEPVK